jgi:hypothetical protein
MSSKKTLHIHLGINKTGSTAIESYCVDYYQELIKRNVTFFPKPYFYQHCWPIYFSSTSKEADAALTQHFNAVIQYAKTDNIFLIDEDLSSLNPFFEGFLIRYTLVNGTFEKSIEKRLKKLTALTKQYDCNFIIYLRRQDLFLESLYSQIIKQRHFFSLTFKEFLDIYPVENLQWDTFIQTIKKCIGKHKLTIKLFDSKEFFNNDIVHDCLHVCDINMNDLPLSKRKNNRLRSDVFENIRAFNEIDFNINPLYHYRRTPIELCQAVNDKAYGFFSKEERKQFLNQFKTSNKNLAIQLNKKTIFSPRKKPTEIIHQEKSITLTKEQISMYKELYFPKPKKQKK